MVGLVNRGEMDSDDARVRSIVNQILLHAGMPVSDEDFSRLCLLYPLVRAHADRLRGINLDPEMTLRVTVLAPPTPRYAPPQSADSSHDTSPAR